MKNTRLKQARVGRDLTQKEMSTQLGISTRQYQCYESGDSIPNVYMAKKIADLVNQTIEDIFFNHRTN